MGYNGASLPEHLSSCSSFLSANLKTTKKESTIFLKLLMLSLLVNFVALGHYFLKPEAEIVNQELRQKLKEQNDQLNPLKGIQEGPSILFLI